MNQKDSEAYQIVAGYVFVAQRTERCLWCGSNTCSHKIHKVL